MAEPPIGKDWTMGGWPLTIVCRFKGHRESAWVSTYQPHVEKQFCKRCGAWRLRTKEDAA